MYGLSCDRDIGNDSAGKQPCRRVNKCHRYEEHSIHADSEAYSGDIFGNLLECNLPCQCIRRRHDNDADLGTDSDQLFGMSYYVSDEYIRAEQ